MKNFILLGFIVLGLPVHANNICATLSRSVENGAPAEHKLKRFLDAQWKYLMTEYPEWATAIGYPGQNDRWTDISLTALTRREDEVKCQLKSLVKIPRQQLKLESQLNFDLVKRRLETEIEGAKFDDKYLVLNQLNGLHTNLPDVLTDMPAANRHDYENMLSRMDKVPLLEEQSEILLREGLKRKVTAVKLLLERVPHQFDSLLTIKVEDSPLYKPFAKMNSNISNQDKAELQAHARELLQNKVYPAMVRLRTFLQNDYIPNARETVSWTSLPNGKEWYAYLAKVHTTTNLTPIELHDLGLREVERISKEMLVVKNQAHFSGDLKAFNHFLLTDKRFYYTNKEELLTGYRDIAKRIDPELTKQFKTLPRLTYGVKEMPDYRAADAPSAYYYGGTLEGGRPGYFMANTSDLRGRPKWAMEALTLHEAVPGHHLQISIAEELKDIPEIRKYGSYTAFIEGWGLYSEGLGEELGLYQDPYSHYGQLSFEMWRAIRLVVDTGIHAMGWTRQQALDYFAKNMPKAKAETENEVDRYITWPGQALAYKVGQLKFHELRLKAQAELGDNFNVREFHDQLLKHGSLPMDVLEQTIDKWIAETKKNNLRHMAEG